MLSASGELQVTHVLFTLRWRIMTQILLALPVFSLFVCLITSLIFHSDHINNTICKVYNFLPSISAVTGVSPQRYLWRVCVALHISPRLLVAWVAKEFYLSLTPMVPVGKRPAFQGLVTLAFCLNLTELATLCGVTYISNKENYPVHEKLFTIFMFTSLVYMLCVIRVFHCVEESLSERHQRSYLHKKWLFALKIASTGGLLFFFWRHRVFCIPKAYSWFSLCEYVIATCNMLYHVSVAMDFSEDHLIVGHIAGSSSETKRSEAQASLVQLDSPQEALPIPANTIVQTDTFKPNGRPRMEVAASDKIEPRDVLRHRSPHNELLLHSTLDLGRTHNSSLSANDVSSVLPSVQANEADIEHNYKFSTPDSSSLEVSTSNEHID